MISWSLSRSVVKLVYGNVVYHYAQRSMKCINCSNSNGYLPIFEKSYRAVNCIIIIVVRPKCGKCKQCSFRVVMNVTLGATFHGVEICYMKQITMFEWCKWRKNLHTCVDFNSNLQLFHYMFYHKLIKIELFRVKISIYVIIYSI